MDGPAPPRRRWFERLTPGRALALALVGVGLAVVSANTSEADESLWLGAALAATGLGALLARETASRRRWLEMLAVLVLVLGGAEVAVRRESAAAQRDYANRQMRFVDDPELKYEFRPATKCGDGAINERGMLDLPRTLEKPEGTLRVVCLGDSVGGDCSLPRTNACAALEEELSLALGGRKVETLNFSVPGYNTMQEARALETKAMAFQPDAIVVLYVLNDPYPELAMVQHLPGHLKFEHLLYFGTLTALGRVVPSLDPTIRGLAALHDRPRAWETVLVRGFDRIEAQASPGGLPVVLSIFPLFIEPRPKLLDGVYEKVATEGRRHGFVPIKLGPDVYGAEPLTAFLKPSRDIIHPDARAHRLAARAIARALAEARPAWKTP